MLICLGRVGIIKYMKVFELHFNPRESEDTIFDSFCYEPINIEEKRLGNLYMVGNLKNVLPQNYKLLEDLAFQIKKEYYRECQRSSERALIESLKRGNKFLENLTKEGNVSWLGNLDFAILVIKNFDFHFTKVENISAFLLRRGKIIDIAQNLSQEEIEPYPLKVFGNLVSGKLIENDVILILTKEVSEIFLTEKLVNEIASLEIFTEKKLKEILEKKEKILKEVFGIALLIALTKEQPSLTQKLPEFFHFEKVKKKFSFKETFSPIKIAFSVFFNFFIKLFQKIFHFIGFRLSLKIKTPSLPKLKTLPVLKFNSLKHRIILILIFALILISGFFLFQFQEKRELANFKNQFIKIQLIAQDAENLLNLNKRVEALKLFLKTWEEIKSLEKNLPEDESALNLKNEVTAFKEKIKASLLNLSNLIRIENPEILFDFSQTNFVPQKMVILNGKIYFFNPIAQDLFELDINQKIGKEIQTDIKFNYAQPITTNSIIFLSKPNNFIQFNPPDQFSETKIQIPGSDFDFIDFKKFYSNFYLLDKRSGNILKCNLKKCEIWLSGETTQKPLNAVSFAIDGSIWVLNKNGTIERYYAGTYQETLKIDIFPELEKPTKISIPQSLPYFYILEPMKNRILIVTKSGHILKQLQSEKFDNLKDFSVSDDGHTLYLLNGLILYQIKL